MKKESRILLHVRVGGYDFIAVLRGVGGMEHLRIFRVEGGVRALAEKISGEGFFHEVRYVVAYPLDLSAAWLEVVRDLGRSDVKIDPKVPSNINEIMRSYVSIFSRLAEMLDRIQSRGPDTNSAR